MPHPKINKALRAAKGTRRPRRTDTSMDWLVMIRAERYRQAAWEQDKAIKRSDNFKKMQYGLVKHKQRQEVERVRQEAINEVRLTNLKKARKARSKK